MEQQLTPKPEEWTPIRPKKRFDGIAVLNATFLILVSLLCILPLIHIVAVSFSSSAAASAGYVRLWPVDFTFASYMYTIGRTEFWQSMLVSLTRIGIGTPLNLLLTILVAYPLSKESHALRFRSVYAWAFFVTMLFNGGLIPWYTTLKEYGLLDSIWALVLPGAVPVFSVVLLLNFFREIPKELEEAALIDGAGHFRTVWSIFVPISAGAGHTRFILDGGALEQLVRRLAAHGESGQLSAAKLYSDHCHPAEPVEYVA